MVLVTGLKLQRAVWHRRVAGRGCESQPSADGGPWLDPKVILIRFLWTPRALCGCW